MADLRDIRLAFTGGELSPSMAARADLRAHQTGLTRCRNWVPTPQGELRSRPGADLIDRAASDTRPTKLLWFDYTIGQSYIAAICAHRMRLYYQGEPLTWGMVSEVATVSTSADTLTFAAPHGYAADDQVWVLSQYGSGTFPSGPSAATVYYVVVVDALTVKISSTAGGGSIVNFTTAGTGVRLGRASTMPRIYRPPQACTFNITLNTVVVSNDYVDGDRVLFAVSGGGALPEPLDAGRPYTVAAATGSGFALLDSLGHPVDLTTALSGTATVARYFNAGDLVYAHVDYPTFFRGPLMVVNNGWVAQTNPYISQFESAVASTASIDIYAFGCMRQPMDGRLELPMVYADADLPDVTFSQSADVLTLTHPSYAAIEVRRTATQWQVVPANLVDSRVPTPLPGRVDWGGLPLTPFPDAFDIDRGSKVVVTQADTVFSTALRIWTATPHLFAKGDPILVENSTNTGVLPDGKYVVTYVEEAWFVVRTLAGALLSPVGLTAFGAEVYLTSLSDPDSHTYAITAVDGAGRESLPVTLVVPNTLGVVGSNNTLRWRQVAAAVQYRVYRRLYGTYGLIGVVPSGDVLVSAGVNYYEFVDDYAQADIGEAFGTADTIFGWVVSASCYFEQRRVMAGGYANPQTVWASRPGLSYDYTFHVPQKDDDRVQFTIGANEPQVIRHVVSGQDLYILTASGEFVMASDGALTPTSFAVRQATAHGSSRCRPVQAGDGVLFVEARGGHVRLLTYDWRTQRTVAPDQSLLATHLFDGFTLDCGSLQKNPNPTAWYTSSSGLLLGMTYVPEQEVRGWHAHSFTGGTVLQCATTREATEDRVYVVVERTVGGAPVRTIERLGSMLPAADPHALDGAVTTPAPTAATITPRQLTASRAAGASFQLTASATVFAASDVRATIRVGDSVFRIDTVTSGTVVTATLTTAGALTASADWSFLRTTLTGLDHLEGLTVTALVDGVETTATVTGGAVTLAAPAETITVGVPFDSVAETLPFAMQADGLGFGRMKNVGHVWLRGSGSIKAGPDVGRAVVVELAEAREVVAPTWNADGAVVFVRSGAKSASLTSAVIGASIGD